MGDVRAVSRCPPLPDNRGFPRRENLLLHDALLFPGFGLAALLLAALGLHGVMALAVRERTRDLGIRRALGAPSALLRRRVLRDALTVTAAGTAVGLGSAMLASRLLTALLFEISPADHVTLVGVPVVLLGVAAVAAKWIRKPPPPE